MKTTTFIDSHTHLYLDSFNGEIDEVIERAIGRGVSKMLLPNIDSSSTDHLLSLCHKYKDNCFPMMGLHPTSVKDDYKLELASIKEKLFQGAYIGVGEIGIDLYWDKTYLKEQEDAFRMQLGWAKKLELPVVIHARDSFDEIFTILDQEQDAMLHGVFHSFTGNEAQLEKALSYDFYIGINGIVTFKNSGLDIIAGKIPLEKLLLETDSPFLAPVPHRGKRNESSYLLDTAKKIATIHQVDIEELAAITSSNTFDLFTKLPRS